MKSAQYLLLFKHHFLFEMALKKYACRDVTDAIWFSPNHLATRAINTADENNTEFNKCRIRCNAVGAHAAAWEVLLIKYKNCSIILYTEAKHANVPALHTKSISPLLISSSIINYQRKKYLFIPHHVDFR